MLPDGYHDVPNGKIAAVVTHLEMTAPPPPRGAPLPAGLTFAPLPDGIDTYRDVFRRIGTPWLWFGRLAMEDATLQALLDDPQITRHTLLRDGTPEALLELDFRTPGACELAYFGLTPALFGTGAGGFLMDRAMDMAWNGARNGTIHRVHLHTCTLDSPQALGFYIRSGFTPTRRQIEIADDPRRTGIHPPDTAPDLPMT